MLKTETLDKKAKSGTSIALKSPVLPHKSQTNDF
jgi:hypothetical protein